jgi:hypothetical protein
MSHHIQPNSLHSLITLELAIRETSPTEVTEGINQLLAPEIGEGWLADYQFINADNQPLVEASEEPKGGELFNAPQSKTIKNGDWEIITSVNSEGVLSVTLSHKDGTEIHQCEFDDEEGKLTQGFTTSGIYNLCGKS